MSADAAWRDSERMRDVEHFSRVEDEELREEVAAKEAAAEAGQTAEFLKKAQKDTFSSAATGSVADRIQRNRHYVQKTGAALEGGAFSRK